jgi:hypothetical protein
MTSRFVRAAPVLQVADVSRSIAWYSEVLGFSGWGFPAVAPHDFALVMRDGAQLLELTAAIERSTPLLRKPERMPYGDVELAVVDPDGHVIVVSEQLPPNADVPFVREGAR